MATILNPRLEGQVILLTVSVYLDILNLFLALLRLFGANSRSDD